MYVQVAAIAGRDGSIFLQRQSVGGELEQLEMLRNAWRPDVRVENVALVTAARADEVLRKIESLRIGGYLYKRSALNRAAKLLATKETRNGRAD